MISNRFGKSKLALLSLVFAGIGCDVIEKDDSPIELYQSCIEEIRISDAALSLTKTLACRREFSTLSEKYIPLGRRLPSQARLLENGRSLSVGNLKNESDTQLIAGVEFWIALPVNATAKCEGLTAEVAYEGVEGCMVRYSSVPVWMAPGQSEDFIADFGISRHAENSTWSWGIYSYRYFELSASKFDQMIDQNLREGTL